MKMNKLFIGLFSLLALSLTACSSDDDENYVWDKVSGSQVYFSNTLPSTIDISIDESSFDIPLTRVDDSEEVTVPLTVVKDNASIFSIPSSVTFAKGEKETVIPVSYDPTAIVFGNYEDIKIMVGDSAYVNHYGDAVYAFKAGATAWEDFGKGYYREDIVTAFYGVENYVYEVDIQRNVVEEGMYRLVNPYGEAYPALEEGDWDPSQDYYLTINAQDPDYVYVETGGTGMDLGSGEVSVSSMVAQNLQRGATLDELKASHPEYFGTLTDGIITMPAGSMLIAEADYNNGAWYSANGSGLFAVALPGHRIADYSTSFTYCGVFTDVSGTKNATGKITLGEDVASAKYALVTGETAGAVYNDIISGGEYPEVTETDGTAMMPFEIGGAYKVLVVAFDADGQAQGYSLTSVKIDDGRWKAIGTGTYSYSLIFGNEDESPSDESGLTLYQSETNPERYKIEPWGIESELTFTKSADGSVLVEDQYIGLEDEEVGKVYIDDLVDYTGSPDYGESYFDNGVFHFAVVYYVDAGMLAYGEETFTLDAGASAAKAQHSAVRKVKKATVGKTKWLHRKNPIMSKVTLR